MSFLQKNKTFAYHILLFIGLMQSCQKKVFPQHNPPRSTQTIVPSDTIQNRFAQRLDRLYKTDSVFRLHTSGLVLYDIKTEQTLYDHNGHRLFTPASNVKILTCLAALKVLKDSLFFGQLSQTNQHCQLKPWGDPSFLNPNLDSLDTRSHFLKKQCSTITVIDYQDLAPYGPGWSWDDTNDSYSTQRTVLPIYGQLMTAQISPSGQPMLSPSIFQDSLSFKKGFDRPKRQWSNNQVFWTKQEIDQDYSQQIPFVTNRKVLENLLQDTLKIPIAIHPLKEAPNYFANSTVIRSPLMPALREMMVESDNFIAEQILIQLSKYLTDTYDIKSGIDSLRNQQIIPLGQASNWVDGSGLSRYNLLSPHDLITALIDIKNEKGLDWIQSSFATGNRSGTIKKLYPPLPNGDPYIYAKTGTLTHVHNISGYLKTTSGKWLIFSQMNNNKFVDQKKLTDHIQLILEFVRDNY